jgi:tRNA pseudouridine55 synthase
MELDGLLKVNKSKGWSSHDVVAYLRKNLRVNKVGHSGTLDPLATGLLLIGLGRATRLLPYLVGLNKKYRAVFKLGQTTDTYDAFGSIREINPIDHLREEEVREVLLDFEGVQTQLPPPFSAVKVEGRRLYEYARNGEEVDAAPRQVEIEKIEIRSVDLPLVEADISCSKGTYIRSIAHQLGERLGVGAHVLKLMRIRVGSFDLEDSVTIKRQEGESLKNLVTRRLVPFDQILDFMPSITMKEEHREIVTHGRPLLREYFEAFDDISDDGYAIIKDENGMLMAVVRARREDERGTPQAISDFKYCRVFASSR